MTVDSKGTERGELIMNVDYFDQCNCAWERSEGLYDEQRIRNLLEKCRDHGFRAVMWRTSVCGKVAYPSKVMTVFDAEYRLSCNSLAEVLATLDPLETAIKWAHRLGLKIHAWVTPFDSYFTGLEDAFFARNPHLLMMSRDGKSVLRGVPCYACPETREYRLREAKELIDYGVDGIFYSSNSHNICTMAMGDWEGEDAFGFNPEVVEEFKKRYGRDIRKESFDKKAFSRLHGEYLTLFLEEVKGCLKEGQQLFVTGGGLENDEAFYIYGHSKDLNFNTYWHQVRIQVDLKKWLVTNLVDRYYIAPYYYSEQFPVLRAAYGEKVKYALAPPDPSPGDEGQAGSPMESFLARLASGELNGLAFHEAMNFEYGPPYGANELCWKNIKKFIDG